MSGFEAVAGSVGERTVTLRVPAQPDVVHVLRAVVASIASRLEFGYDQIDDLRLATSEVVTHLLEEHPPPDALVVRVGELDEGIEVVAARTSAIDTWPPTGARHSLTTLILRALTDEASFDRTDDGPAIRFVKRCAPGVARTR
jgi:hypothetical protein